MFYKRNLITVLKISFSETFWSRNYGKKITFTHHTCSFVIQQQMTSLFLKWWIFKKVSPKEWYIVKQFEVWVFVLVKFWNMSYLPKNISKREGMRTEDKITKLWGGVKHVQKSVHMVYEWPQSIMRR